MAEWEEVIHNVKRICERREGKCGTCRLGYFACPNNSRFDMTDEKEFDKFAEEVMQWAKENPEPKYPTWGEWLVEQGVVTDMKYWYAFNDEMMKRPIRADIAEKLGALPRR